MFLFKLETREHGAQVTVHMSRASSSCWVCSYPTRLGLLLSPLVIDEAMKARGAMCSRSQAGIGTPEVEL